MTNTQVSRLHKAFANNSSANIKLSKTQLHKIGQSGGSLGRLLRPLLGIAFNRNVLKPLAKSILISLGLTAAASATDTAIHKKILESGACPLDLAKQTTLVIPNEKMNDIMKIVKSLEESRFFNKSVSKTIGNEAKEQKGGLLGMLLGTLGASLLGNLLTGKDTIRPGEGTIRAGRDF